MDTKNGFFDDRAPVLRSDGVNLSKDHLRREDTVNSIIETARFRQHVVVGAPPATGKTSLLQLVGQKLQTTEGATVHYLYLTDSGIDDLWLSIAEKGIHKNNLRELEKCWLILDGAQNVYDPKYAPFWQFIVKHISGAGVHGKVFVIIAASYDYAASGTVVEFGDLAHVHSNITPEEAIELYNMHSRAWGCENWEKYRETLLALSKISNEVDGHHVGVVIGGIRLLEEFRKSKEHFDEVTALSLLRSDDFIVRLDRSFILPSDLELESHETILKVLLGTGRIPESRVIDQLIRMGIIYKEGNFSCPAANWYYNRNCFPNCVDQAPGSLDELVKLAVGSLSARRLRDNTLDDGFPKETTFQHLFNEAFSLHLPLYNYIIPELNTYAVDANGEVQTEELDFYIGESLQWCLELTRKGDKIGEHLSRFDEINDKYRKVQSNDYLVVDCQGPKAICTQPHRSKCTLYFAEDFSSCVCKMRMDDEVTIQLDL